VETTPNPKSMKFLPEGRDVLGAGNKTMLFRSEYEAGAAPLAQALFKVGGVREVMLAAQHVTVTKTALADWDELQERVEQCISGFYDEGRRLVDEGALDNVQIVAAVPGSIEARILELLEERVKPSIQQDGGDIAFERYDEADGSLYLRLQGSCSGCSQSHATLQEGVRNLMNHYVPEVKQIIGMNEEEEEDIPRPGWR